MLSLDAVERWTITAGISWLSARAAPPSGNWLTEEAYADEADAVEGGMGG
jgi:hypothetical protein